MIVATAHVAKASPASALHVIAAGCLLHPVVAFRALFKLLSSDELHEILVVLVLLVRDLILLARLPTVIQHSAVEAVVLIAQLALEGGVALEEEEHVLAASGGAPRCVLLFIENFIYGEILIFFPLFLI